MIELIEKEISKLPLGSNPKSLYEPIRYIMKLGGKRLRPMLVLTGYQLYKKDVASAAKYAAAVEAFHNFTLMHDDIMDKAPLRRGKPTVHEKYNSNTAILSGDVMLVKVYDMFLSLPDHQLKEVLRLFNKTAAEVCEGQQMDMDFETMKKVSEKDYLEMIRLKTAVLLGFSLELGAILADASAEDRKALYDFGVNIGVGFQLMDDFLDVYGDQKKFGKAVGGDIVSNKKTYLLIKALERDKAQLNKWIAAKKFDRKKKVAAVTKIYDTLGVGELTRRKADRFFEEGYRGIEQLNNPNKELLLKLTKELAARQK